MGKVKTAVGTKWNGVEHGTWNIVEWTAAGGLKRRDSPISRYPDQNFCLKTKFAAAAAADVGSFGWKGNVEVG